MIMFLGQKEILKGGIYSFSVYVVLLGFLLSTNIAWSQTNEETHHLPKNIVGVVYDMETNEALAFASIGIKGKSSGTISNVNGQFYLTLSNYSYYDTLVCSYLGYAVRYFPSDSIEEVMRIPMVKTSMGLSGVTVLSRDISAKDIVRRMLDSRSENHAYQDVKDEVFSRTKTESRKKQFDIKLKKSTIDYFNEEMFERVSLLLPDLSMYYEDWLYRIYNFGTESKKQRVKGVTHQEGDYDELEVVAEEIEQILNEKTQENTYWKFRSGPLLSFRIDDNEETDTINEERFSEVSLNDSIAELDETLAVARQSNTIDDYLDRMVWRQDFFMEIGRYNYNLEGSVFMGDESAYVISFKPKSSGMVGKMYISMETFALMRLDYSKPKGVKGEGIKLLGFEYRSIDKEVMVLFQRYRNVYRLKYTMHEELIRFGVKRPIGFVQKRERFMFDKKIEQIDFKLETVYEVKQTSELLVTQTTDITQEEFDKVMVKRGMHAELVEQYNDPTIWEGYSIIEPTQEMKEYRAKKR